jgi:cytochrome c
VAKRLILSLTVLTILVGAAPVRAEEAPNERELEGHALAERMCASCHAIEKSGSSPHAGAPPFRELCRRVDLDDFARQLRQGLTSGHPDMPTFRFSREDAGVLVAYLRSIQGP